jgi:hypothetical protein
MPSTTWLSLALISVSYDKPSDEITAPIRLSEFVSEYASQTGHNLSVSARLSDHLVIIREPESLGDKLLPYLATAVSGRWIESKGTLRLDLDGALAESREKTLRTRLQTGLEKVLAELVPRPAAQTDLAAAEAILREIERLPAQATAQTSAESLAFLEGYYSAGGLGRRLLRSLGASTLMTLRDGETRVYCTSPVKGEFPFGPKLLAEIEKHQSTQVLLAGLLQSRRAPPKLERVWEAILNSANSLNGDVQVHLAIGRSGLHYGARCDLYADNVRVDGGICSLIPIVQPTSSFSAESRQVSLSKLSKLAKDLFDSGNREQISPQIPDPSTASLIATTGEPLRFCVPELINAVARGPLIAVITDEMLPLALRFFNNPTADVKAFADTLQSNATEILKEPGVTVIRPIAPSIGSSPKSLRTAIKQHLLQHKSTRDIPSYDLLQYYCKAWKASPSVPVLVRFYPNILQALGWRILIPERIHPTGFEFLGSLDYLQLRSLETGDTTSLARLAPHQQDLAHQWFTKDTFGGTDFSSSGAHRSYQDGPWVMAAQPTHNPFLAARSRGSYSPWLPDSARSIAEWKERIALRSKSTGKPVEELAREVEWAVLPSHAISFQLTAKAHPKLTATLRWSISAEPKFVPWDSIEDSIRSQIISP